MDKAYEKLKEIKNDVISCKKCSLFKTRTFPVIGKGNHRAEIMFIGEAPACVTLGGVLIRGVDQVEVKGLAKDLPKEIEVDISGLNTFEDKILIKDLTLPEEVEILNHEKDDAICHVAEPKQEKEPEPEAEVTEGVEEGTEEEAPTEESEEK